MKINQKGFALIAIILAVVGVLVLAVVVGYFALNNRPAISLLRVCPEEWIENRMPSTVESGGVPNEYFIYKGVRQELSEFDINWVKTNCSVKPKAIY